MMIIIMRLNAVTVLSSTQNDFDENVGRKKINQNFHGSPSTRQCRTINFLDYAGRYRWKSFEIKTTTTTTTPSQMAFNATKNVALFVYVKKKRGEK